MPTACSRRIANSMIRFLPVFFDDITNIFQI